MKVFKPTFTDKRTGKTRKCAHWYLSFSDNKGIRRRLPAFTSKGASERAAAKIEELLSCGGILNQDLQRTAGQTAKQTNRIRADRQSKTIGEYRQASHRPLD